MSKTEIWHNPRCSKSRQTLALLREHAIEPDILLYKETPPTKEDIRAALSELNLSARDLIRQKDAAFKELNLPANASEDVLIEAMVQHPAIIERPVVRHGGKAALGRPPESVLDLFK